MTLIDSVTIPEAKSGNCEIFHFSVSDQDAKLDAIRSFGRRSCPPGDYTGLRVNGRLMMSDTPDEKRDHYEAVRHANGVCLVNGLGLGMVANAMARKDSVERVDVIEISSDVIELVGASLHPKIKVIHHDAFSYSPPKGLRYGCVWHDIWQDICTDDLQEHAKLNRKYGRRTDWQGAWVHDLLLYHRSKEKRSYWG